MSIINREGRQIIIQDMCLRDGMHAKREQISVEEMRTIASAIDSAGVPMLQVGHGAGLGGEFSAAWFCPPL